MSNHTLFTWPSGVLVSSTFFMALKSSSDIVARWTVVLSPLFLRVFITQVNTLLQVVNSVWTVGAGGRLSCFWQWRRNLQNVIDLLLWCCLKVKNYTFIFTSIFRAFFFLLNAVLFMLVFFQFFDFLFTYLCMSSYWFRSRWDIHGSIHSSIVWPPQRLKLILNISIL